MQRVSVVLASLAFVWLGLATPSRAATVQLQDIFDPADLLFAKDSEGICIGDNATDTVSGEAAGCLSLLYSITLSPEAFTSASLDLYLRDDGDHGNNPEAVRITLDSIVAGEYSIVNSPFTFDVLASISPDGLLNVFLERGSQGQGQADFYFDKGVLNAEWDDGTDVDAVPEPASLLLIGAGFAAAAYRRRMGRGRSIG